MSRFYIRLVLIPIALFTLTLMLIHAQPYDDHELRELLLPESCPAPCFMGIRPGVTTIEKAITLLEASRWLDHYKLNAQGNQITLVWNNHSPSWLSKDNDHLFSGSRLSIIDGRVASIALDTNLKLGDMKLIFGDPLLQNANVNIIYGNLILGYSATYADSGLAMNAYVPCNMKNNHFNYQSNVFVVYRDIIVPMDFPTNYHDSWSDILKLSCQ
ncbi:MAG: hypothetical protein GC179_12535 [Anaerolineaceae bacterium]|nr:hypothetical protein [Anaerolineaceae bacterium]